MSAMTNPPIRLARPAPGLATLTLNRPAVYNALDLASMIELQKATLALAEDPSVRVVLVQGEGPAFSGGGDLSFFSTRQDDPSAMLEDIGRALNPAILALRRMSAIVVMSVHGSVAGGSVGLMLAGDIVIAASDTRFNLAYAKMGGSPDAGASWFLPRVAGHGAAIELFALSDTFMAERAAQLGLVNHVVAPAEREAFTQRLVGRLLAAPAVTLANVKRLVTQAQTSELAPHLEEEIAAYARACRSPGFREGVAAFLEKRKPVFNNSEPNP
jgi:2-(1,2-epoxy-1,2-dihydrophenyl)acetyl-CoA isomerase